MDIADRADQHIEDELQFAIARCRAGATTDVREYLHCIECGAPISHERRLAVPYVNTCVGCAEAMEFHGQELGTAPRLTQPWWA